MSNLEMGIPSHRYIKYITQSHRACKWLKQDLNPGTSVPAAVFLDKAVVP